MLESIWLPLIYQYSIGGIVFTTAIIIAIRKGALSLKLRKDKRILFQLIGGFILYITIHIILTLASGA